jgi:signal peptidase I
MGSMALTLSIHLHESHYAKRVVGLLGDHVTCCDSGGVRAVNDMAVDKFRLHPGDKPGHLTFDATVPAERMWAMGQHRSDSADSGAHLGDYGGGMVRLDDVVGRAGMICWPPGRDGILGTPVSHVSQSLRGITARAAGVRHS